MSTVLIERKSSRDIRMRDLYVRVDDLPEDTLVYGESLELDLEPGPHRVLVTNRVFSKRLEFDLSEGQTATFSAACVPSRSILSVVMMLTGTVPYKVDIRQT